MDRFPEERISNLPHMMKIWGEQPPPVVLNVCENCDQSCDRLTLVPGFEYLGCDQCMEEALAVIAREKTVDPETGCTPKEMAAMEHSARQADLARELWDLAIGMNAQRAREIRGGESAEKEVA